MVDRKVELACPQSAGTAKIPAAREARIKRERAVDQGYHGAEILAEIRENAGGICEDARIIPSDAQRSPGAIRGFPTVCLLVFALTVVNKPKIANGSVSECGSIFRITLDRLLKKIERFAGSRRKHHRVGAQIEVVRGEVICWAAGRARGLGGLQGWLDDPGDARCHLVLEVENVFERSVEAVGPHVRPGCGVDQLRGDANSITASA